MKVFCAGFNLYGQFINIRDTCIENFTSIIYSNATDIHIGHSFLILNVKDTDSNSKENKIYIQGFLQNMSHQNEELVFHNEHITQIIIVSNSKAFFLSENENIFVLNFNTDSNNLCLLENTTKYEKYTTFIEKFEKIFSDFSNINNIPFNFIYKIPNTKDICMGKEHMLILTQDASVYSIGGGSRGQLGHNTVEDKDVPECITNLKDINIVKIACGAWHSIALSSDGDIYTWGWNSNGQLGLKTSENEHVSIIPSPQFVNFHEKVIDICCGFRHTIILTENLKLYGCGWNRYCQLGFKSNEENIFEFKLLNDFSNSNVIGLRCGTWNTAVLIAD